MNVMVGEDCLNLRGNVSVPASLDIQYKEERKVEEHHRTVVRRSIDKFEGKREIT